MRIVVEQWKYIFKNLWFVLPFAVVPAVFLALSVDFRDISLVTHSLFFGSFDLSFYEIFSAWTFFRIDSVLGVIYSVLAIICLVLFSSLLLAFVGKHMRIGKRTLSGVIPEFVNHTFSAFVFVLVFGAIYEIWALILSAVLYMIVSIASKTAARILFIFISLIFMAALLYIVSAIYLWLPCKVHTGFRAYEAFLYSYRLVSGVRWRLYLSFLLSYAPCFLVLFGASFGPEWISRLLAIVLYLFGFLSFIVRMETLYFETDKLDREDLLRSYRGLTS